MGPSAVSQKGVPRCEGVIWYGNFAARARFSQLLGELESENVCVL